MVNSTDQQDASAQTVHQKTVCVDGQDFHVVYKAQGNNVEIVSASKGATSDVATDESQRDGQTKDAVQRSGISPDEMSKIQEKVKEEHKQENKTEAVGYKNVEEISDRIDCVTKVSKHVYGQKENEFNDPSRGQPQNIHTMADYRQHAIDTMKDPATSCFVGQNGSDKNPDRACYAAVGSNETAVPPLKKLFFAHAPVICFRFTHDTEICGIIVVIFIVFTGWTTEINSATKTRIPSR